MRVEEAKMISTHLIFDTRPARLATLASIMGLLVLGGCSPEASSEPERVIGEPIELGSGTVHAYADLNPDGSPIAIGIGLSRSSLETLPTEKNKNMARCFDVDGDGELDVETECHGDHAFTISLLDVLAKSPETHFKWIGLDWNPMGHVPPGVYDLPHFDVHFYTASREAVRQIRPGTCGELVDCEDFERGIIPVPEKYVAPDYADLEAIVPDMGNHLVDLTTPELGDPPVKFTHTFIYGAFDGHITFFEPMITTEFLLSNPDECVPIKLPEAWEVAGYYPTEYCMRHLEDEAAYTISLEGFVHRAAG
jgi:hypothetical protein